MRKLTLIVFCFLALWLEVISAETTNSEASGSGEETTLQTTDDPLTTTSTPLSEETQKVEDDGEPTTTEQQEGKDNATTPQPDDRGNRTSGVFNNPHFFRNRSVIVHLHEWTFSDIARECEDFLGPLGYGGVQISPASENVILPGRPWYERYQPISYRIATRSGDAGQLSAMVQRCRAVGVRIYVDVVPNHMTSNLDEAIGTGGSRADPHQFVYPEVNYTAEDFNQPPCEIVNYDDPVEARVCEMVGLHDLNQTVPRVQSAIVDFLDRLTALGVAGFRVDAAKHMFPADLEKIYSRIEKLPTKASFPPGSNPFIYQEVGDGWKFNYTHLGAVTEFAHATNMAKFFKNQSRAADLRSYGGPHMGMLESRDALVFVDNHDLQRQNPFTLNYKSPREFRAANSFTLAHPYGIVRVMSSFKFNDDQDGPPHDAKYRITRPRFNVLGQSISGWVAEHRWPAIANMVRFRKVVGDSPLTNWWDDGDSVLSFCRGQRGFIAVSGGNYDFKGRVHTCLPPGVYCDVIGKRSLKAGCPKKYKVTVDPYGDILLNFNRKGPELALALHVEDRA